MPRFVVVPQVTFLNLFKGLLVDYKKLREHQRTALATGLPVGNPASLIAANICAKFNENAAAAAANPDAITIATLQNGAGGDLQEGAAGITRDLFVAAIRLINERLDGAFDQEQTRRRELVAGLKATLAIAGIDLATVPDNAANPGLVALVKANANPTPEQISIELAPPGTFQTGHEDNVGRDAETAVREGIVAYINQTLVTKLNALRNLARAANGALLIQPLPVDGLNPTRLLITQLFNRLGAAVALDDLTILLACPAVQADGALRFVERQALALVYQELATVTAQVGLLAAPYNVGPQVTSLHALYDILVANRALADQLLHGVGPALDAQNLPNANIVTTWVKTFLAGLIPPVHGGGALVAFDANVATAGMRAEIVAGSATADAMRDGVETLRRTTSVLGLRSLLTAVDISADLTADKLKPTNLQQHREFFNTEPAVSTLLALVRDGFGAANLNDQLNVANAGNSVVFDNSVKMIDASIQYLHLRAKLGETFDNAAQLRTFTNLVLPGVDPANPDLAPLRTVLTDGLYPVAGAPALPANLAHRLLELALITKPAADPKNLAIGAYSTAITVLDHAVDIMRMAKLIPDADAWAVFTAIDPAVFDGLGLLATNAAILTELKNLMLDVHNGGNLVANLRAIMQPGRTFADAAVFTQAIADVRHLVDLAKKVDLLQKARTQANAVPAGRVAFRAATNILRNGLIGAQWAVGTVKGDLADLMGSNAAFDIQAAAVALCQPPLGGRTYDQLRGADAPLANAAGEVTGGSVYTEVLAAINVENEARFTLLQQRANSLNNVIFTPVTRAEGMNYSYNLDPTTIPAGNPLLVTRNAVIRALRADLAAVPGATGAEKLTGLAGTGIDLRLGVVDRGNAAPQLDDAFGAVTGHIDNVFAPRILQLRDLRRLADTLWGPDKALAAIRGFQPATVDPAMADANLRAGLTTGFTAIFGAGKALDHANAADIRLPDNLVFNKGMTRDNNADFTANVFEPAKRIISIRFLRSLFANAAPGDAVRDLNQYPIAIQAFLEHWVFSLAEPNTTAVGLAPVAAGVVGGLLNAGGANGFDEQFFQAQQALEPLRRANLVRELAGLYQGSAIDGPIKTARLDGLAAGQGTLAGLAARGNALQTAELGVIYAPPFDTRDANQGQLNTSKTAFDTQVNVVRAAIQDVQRETFLKRSYLTLREALQNAGAGTVRDVVLDAGLLALIAAAPIQLNTADGAIHQAAWDAITAVGNAAAFAGLPPLLSTAQMPDDATFAALALKLNGAKAVIQEKAQRLTLLRELQAQVNATPLGRGAFDAANFDIPEIKTFAQLVNAAVGAAGLDARLDINGADFAFAVDPATGNPTPAAVVASNRFVAAVNMVRYIHETYRRIALFNTEIFDKYRILEPDPLALDPTRAATRANVVAGLTVQEAALFRTFIEDTGARLPAGGIDSSEVMNSYKALSLGVDIAVSGLAAWQARIDAFDKATLDALPDQAPLVAGVVAAIRLVQLDQLVRKVACLENRTLGAAAADVNRAQRVAEDAAIDPARLGNPPERGALLQLVRNNSAAGTVANNAGNRGLVTQVGADAQFAPLNVQAVQLAVDAALTAEADERITFLQPIIVALRAIRTGANGPVAYAWVINALEAANGGVHAPNDFYKLIQVAKQFVNGPLNAIALDAITPADQATVRNAVLYVPNDPLQPVAVGNPTTPVPRNVFAVANPVAAIGVQAGNYDNLIPLATTRIGIANDIIAFYYANITDADSNADFFTRINNMVPPLAPGLLVLFQDVLGRVMPQLVAGGGGRAAVNPPGLLNAANHSHHALVMLPEPNAMPPGFPGGIAGFPGALANMYRRAETLDPLMTVMREQEAARRMDLVNPLIQIFLANSAGANRLPEFAANLQAGLAAVLPAVPALTALHDFVIARAAILNPATQADRDLVMNAALNIIMTPALALQLGDIIEVARRSAVAQQLRAERQALPVAAQNSLQPNAANGRAEQHLYALAQGGANVVLERPDFLVADASLQLSAYAVLNNRAQTHANRYNDIEAFKAKTRLVRARLVQARVADFARATEEMMAGRGVPPIALARLDECKTRLTAVLATLNNPAHLALPAIHPGAQSDFREVNDRLNALSTDVREIQDLLNNLQLGARSGNFIAFLKGMRLPDTLAPNPTLADVQNRLNAILPIGPHDAYREINIPRHTYARNTLERNYAAAAPGGQLGSAVVAVTAEFASLGYSSVLNDDINAPQVPLAEGDNITEAMRGAFFVNDMLRVQEAYTEASNMAPDKPAIESFKDAIDLANEMPMNAALTPAQLGKLRVDETALHLYRIKKEVARRNPNTRWEIDPSPMLKLMRDFHGDPGPTEFICGPNSMVAAEYFSTDKDFRIIQIKNGAAGRTLFTDLPGGRSLSNIVMNLGGVETRRLNFTAAFDFGDGRGARPMDNPMDALMYMANDLEANPNARPTAAETVKVMQTVYLHMIDNLVEHLAAHPLGNNNFGHVIGDGVKIKHTEAIFKLLERLILLYKTNANPAINLGVLMTGPGTFLDRFGIDQGRLDAALANNARISAQDLLGLPGAPGLMNSAAGAPHVADDIIAVLQNRDGSLKVNPHSHFLGGGGYALKTQENLDQAALNTKIRPTFGHPAPF